MSESLADQFIAAMAEINAMDSDSNHAMRHEIYALKNSITINLSSAIREAHMIARQTRQIKKSCDEAVNAALEKKGGK